MQAVAGIRRGLTIDPAGEEEAPADRIGRLVRESPVVIFARRGCYMAHVMKRLLAAVGAHATVIELEGAAEELAAAEAGGHAAVPALFVGGAPVGGLEGLMGLHLSGRLVPRLREEDNILKHWVGMGNGGGRHHELRTLIAAFDRIAH